MTNLRSTSFSALACSAHGFAAQPCTASLTASLAAQTVAPTVRIVNRIDESQLVTLKGNTHLPLRPMQQTIAAPSALTCP